MISFIKEFFFLNFSPFSEKQDYELPDGTTLTFHEERFDFGECLFTSIPKKESKVCFFKYYYLIQMLFLNRILKDIAIKVCITWS